MGLFAETAIVDYRLSSADRGKQTFVFRFKQKTEAQAIFLNPSTVCPFVDEETNEKLPVCKRTKRTCSSTGTSVGKISIASGDITLVENVFLLKKIAAP